MSDANNRPMSKAELEAYIADDFIPAMRKMLPVIAPLPEWQPIETAPKDGTDVLLNREGYLKVGSWCYDEGEPARTVWECGGFLLHDPTHWMPLPKPPLS